MTPYLAAIYAGIGNFYNNAIKYLCQCLCVVLCFLFLCADPCIRHSSLSNDASNCAGFGAVLWEETRDFGVGWTQDPSAQKSYEHFYQPAEKVQGLSSLGQLGWYSGGGYIYPFIHPLKGRQKHYIREMKKLRENNWINKDTRAALFEFSVYNAQVNLFAYVTFFVEIMPGGGIVPSHRIEVFRLMRYHTGFGLFTLICEVTFMAFIIYFTIRETKDLVKLKKLYFQNAGNVMEFLMCILGWVGFALFIQREIITQEVLEKFKATKGTGHIRLQYASMVDEIYGYIVAILVFLANLKFLHLLRFNKRFGILTHTLIGCAAELSGFAVCLLIVFLAFVQLFYLILGIQMLDFSTLMSSVEASFSMMLGKFKFKDIVMVSPIMGPLVFFIFALSTTLILLNILLTIVIKSFFDVKEELMKRPNEFEMMEFIKKRILATLGLERRHKIEPVDEVKNEKPSPKVDQFIRCADRMIEHINGVYLNEPRQHKGNVTKRKLLKPAMLKSVSVEEASRNLDSIEMHF